MAGDRTAYEQSMNAGHNAAWDQEWQLAVASYGRAIREFPNDPEAHLHLGLGLLEIGRLEDALKVYTRAAQLSPNDPIPLEKSADVLERMGRLRESAQQYVNVAEVYLTQRDLDKAIYNWRRATQLTPGLIPIHAKLAQAYERIGDKKRAVHEFLTLTYNFWRINDQDKAMKAAQRALRLDKNNTSIINTIRALEAGRDILPPNDDAALEPRAAEKRDTRDVIPEGDPLGPMGEAMNYALGGLATFIMESPEGMNAAAEALLAMELHRQTEYADAVTAYQKADAKLRHPSIKMNLGALLVMTDRPNEAIRPLTEAANDAQMATGANQALGMANAALKRYKQAMRHFLHALQAVADDDLTQSSQPSIFTELAPELTNLNDEYLEVISQRFTDLLRGKDWQQRVSDIQRQLVEIMREQGIKGVIDFLLADDSDRLAASVALIDQYVRKGLFTLAMDEAHRAVEFSPYYLPIHHRMAEVMMKEGRVRQAIAKYNTIARTYLSRGENERAGEILGDVLEMAPLDIAVREAYIGLLEEEERWSEALDQYIGMADVHHQLGNFEQARETFVLSERIGQRINAVPEKIVQIKHRIADIDQMRLDIRKAQKSYEEIIQLDPNDERAHRMLVDLNYRQGNQVEAIRRLDKLLSIYARSKQVQRIVKLLEELVALYPNDTGLRARLAAIYQQVKRIPDAIQQLDALGELQLEAGLHKEAANTIRQIIALKPPRVEDYEQLLAQLGG